MIRILISVMDGNRGCPEPDTCRARAGRRPGAAVVSASKELDRAQAKFDAARAG
jgi:hypothetical protein